MDIIKLVKQTQPNRTYKIGLLIAISLLFFLYFLIIFHRLFQEYALPGRYDSWFHLALFQEYDNRIASYLTGIHTGYSMFPENGLVKYGEPSLLSSLIYLAIKFFLGDPIISFALFTILLCSINGVSFYLLATTYTTQYAPCLAGAVLFSSSNFLFGNIDHQNVYFFGNALLQLFFLRKFLYNSKNKNWFAFIFFGVLQIYFSSTVFIYANVAAIALITDSFFSKTHFKNFIQKIFSGYLLIFIGILPFTFTYIFSGIFNHTFNHASNSSGTYIATIHPIDLIRVVQGNYLYPPLNDISFPLLNNIRSAFTGISTMVLILYCLIRKLKVNRALIAILITGIILSAGSGYYFNGHLIPMPMKLFYDMVGGDSILRTPCRGYILVIFSISLICTMALADIFDLTKSNLPVLLFAAFFILENVPFNMQFFPAEKLIKESNICQLGIMNRKSEIVVVHLPSKILKQLPTFNSFPDEISREFIYTYWAGIGGYNCINGVNGIAPWSRMKNDSLMEHIAEPDHLRQLIQNNHLNFIVWHKDLLTEQDVDQTEFLTSSPLLKFKCQNEESYVFEVSDTDNLRNVELKLSETATSQ
jgi:hypothetical protein